MIVIVNFLQIGHPDILHDWKLNHFCEYYPGSGVPSLKMSSSYDEDDPIDKENQDEQTSEAKLTVILLSCLLALAVICLIIVAYYFYRRYKADQRAPQNDSQA
jgi:hypothetical protein